MRVHMPKAVVTVAMLALMLATCPAAGAASARRARRARRPKPPTRLWYRLRLEGKGTSDLFNPAMRGPTTTTMRGTSRHAVIVEKLADGTFETGAAVEGALLGGRHWTDPNPSIFQCTDQEETYVPTTPGRFGGGVSLRLDRHVSRSEAMFNLDTTLPIRGIDTTTESDCTYPDGTTIVAHPATQTVDLALLGVLACDQQYLVYENVSGTIAFGRSFAIDVRCKSHSGVDVNNTTITVDYHLNFDICPRGGRDVVRCE